MEEKQILERLGSRDEDGRATLPERAINGDPANSNMQRLSKGLRPYFVCLPHNTYRPTEDELKPFRDYVAKITAKNISVKPATTATKPKDD